MKKVYYLQDKGEELRADTGSILLESTFNHCVKLNSSYSLLEYVELVEPN